MWKSTGWPVFIPHCTSWLKGLETEISTTGSDLKCLVKKKGKGYGIRLYSPYRRCWSPFLGPSARKFNGGLGASHPVLSHTLPVYLPQISPGTHLEVGWLWLSLQSHATDPRPKLKNWVHRDSNPSPFRQRIPNPEHQSILV